MAITITRDLNMVPVGVPPVIHLSQYDDDFSLVFNLYSSVGTFTVESSTTAEIRGTKEDGYGYSANATIDISNKRVTVAGNNQMTACAGQNTFELVLKKNNKVLSTVNFILDVERAALDAGTITDESVLKEFNAIIAGAAEATDAANRAEIAATSVETSVDQISDMVDFESTSKTISTTATGWRLNENDGLCSANSNYKLDKYTVTAGKYVKVVSDDRFQFQTVASVPSTAPSNRVGGTYGIGTFVLRVPETATYLIVSTPKTGSTATVYDVKTIKDEVTELSNDVSDISGDVAELEEIVDNLEPGLSSDAKDALMACFEHVKWDNENGQDYYDDLYNALYGVQPDPEVPTAYTRYGWIKLKPYNEVPSGVYNTGSATSGTVDINANNGGKSAMIFTTNAYSDLNALKYKFKFGLVTPAQTLTTSVNACAFGGGKSSNATSRFASYWNVAKQWFYLMAHGQEVQYMQTLNDVNNVEINNGQSSTEVIVNGTTHSHSWVNSDVLNTKISMFNNYNFVADAGNFYGAPTYIKVGDIEIKNQNNEPISKLIPVVRKSDNVIGIWDSVQEAFYTTSDSKYTTIGNASCIYEVGNWSN